MKACGTKLLAQVESHRGEQTVFPGPDDELLDGQVMQLIDLKAPSRGGSTPSLRVGNRLFGTAMAE